MTGARAEGALAAIPPAWADLPFFARDWPGLCDALAADPRPVLPPPPLVFRALDLVPPDAVRVVLLGQDPYPQPGKADGLAFSVPDPVPRPRRDSLSEILAEVAEDTGRPRLRGDLADWAAQGILLLNTALTVPAGAAGGHARLGWQRLAGDVLARVSLRPAAFLLWGDSARAHRRHIGGSGHLVLEAGHPSPLNTRGGFRGSRPFTAVNAWLAARGEPPIRWA